MDLKKCMQSMNCKSCKDFLKCDGKMDEKQKIVINYKLDNWNETVNKCRSNPYYANKQKKKEMDIVRYHLLGIPKIEKYPIKLKCIWHVTNLNSDLDNKSLKSVLDQMQLSGIIENDNCKHINEIQHKAIKDSIDYLEIEIEESVF